MATPISTLEICRSDNLYKPAEELIKLFPEVVVKKIMRIREMHQWFVANPSATDRQYVDETCQRHAISKVCAYDDLKIIKAILPTLSSASRDFHRHRYNEMILETYNMAKKRKDTKIMERAATSYARNNRVDLEDEQKVPYDKIVPQIFTATDDPRVLGIEPIPNINEKISAMIQKYRAETIDIEDVEFEEADLEFDSLFSDSRQSNDERQESIL